MEEKKSQLIFGINPLLEALKASKRRCYKIIIESGKSGAKIGSILHLSRSMKLRVEHLPKQVLQKKFAGLNHQGVIGYFAPKATLDLQELIHHSFKNNARPTLVILDGVQDPQNMGAIIRSAEALGIQGLILPRHRSALLNETVAKCSAGAIEHLPIAIVNNLVQTIEELKKAEFWIVGVDAKGEKPCYDFKFDVAVALVIGGEEKGARPLVKKACDFSISIPMTGSLDSLNVSSASAILFYEILRQKTGAGKTPKTSGYVSKKGRANLPGPGNFL